MKREIIIRYRIVNVVVMVISIMFFLRVNFAVGAELYGCPKDEMAMFNPSSCPDGSIASKIKEGYICDGDKLILNTLSKEDQQKYGIKKDDKFMVVIYKSLYTGEAGFSPGKDKLGNQLEKSTIELKYGCGGVLSTRPLTDNCKPLGDTPEDLEREKERMEPQFEESIARTIEQSWPIFYKQHKDQGVSDEIIKQAWEEYKKNVYSEYNYDPVTKKFKTTD